MNKQGYAQDSRRYDAWLDKAGEDLCAATVLRGDDRCYGGAAFHCQQAVEKALKAYILLRSGELCEGHSLIWLCKRATRHDQKFSGWLDESAALGNCYIETRYPSDSREAFDFGAVCAACDMALDMFRFICEQVDAHFERPPKRQFPSVG